jgi:hypothetical protein
MKSLKTEIFKRMIIVILLMIIILGIVTPFFFYKYRKINIYYMLKIENSDVSNYIRAYF